MKTDRELLALAREKRTAEYIAQKLRKPEAAVMKAAKRLGVDLGQQPIPKPKAKK